jgi:cyclohexyl-isocyanide hydratase
MNHPPRRIALLAFPRVTLLDLVGVYDGLRRLATMNVDPEVTHQIIGTEAAFTDDSGFPLRPESVYPSLDAFDLLVVPGGFGTRALGDDPRFVEWLRGWGSERPIASVCTGSLLLGHAGHLTGLRATTHHTALLELRPFCREVVLERIVDEGRVVTAGGVTSALDLGLHLVAKYWGAEARKTIATQMEYRGS